MVDDVRGVGVIKMMMVDDMGEGGIKNDQKSDDVICGQPLAEKLNKNAERNIFDDPMENDNSECTEKRNFDLERG